jgi:hypothetical protein
LIWDFEADEDYGRTLIKHGDVVIFSEPARYEEYRRFEEIAQILKATSDINITCTVSSNRGGSAA